MKNLAVFCSGFGSNLQAIINAVKRGKITARIAVVVSDKADAFALVRARKAGIPIVVVDPAAYATRTAYDKRLVAVLGEYAVDYVVLAGYMRILTPYFVKKFSHRILNIHPALLPSFKGMHGVRDALRAGVKITGVTVHFVTADLDAGPIIMQEAVRVRDDDTEETLARRIHRCEHALYPRAIQRVVQGTINIEGRKVTGAA